MPARNTKLEDNSLPLVFLDDRELGAYIPAYIFHAGLTATEFRVYSQIAFMAGGPNHRASPDRFARSCQLTERAVHQALSALESRKLLTIVTRDGLSEYWLSEPAAGASPLA